MTRRPRRDRPPRLDDLPPSRPSAPVVSEPDRPVSLAALLAERRVVGPHARLGWAELGSIVTRLAAGQGADLGLDLGRISREEAEAALAAIWGADDTRARVFIDPERTSVATTRAAERCSAVASRGGRVALATSRPASLLAAYCRLASAFASAGAEVIDVGVFAPDTGNRSLWWVDGVAVVTDGVSLLADLDGACADDWLFAVGRPDLVIADRGFAAAAVGAGLETIAFADVDAVVLGVAARRDRPVRVIPVDEQRPPGSYEPLVEALTAGLLQDSAAEGPGERPGEASAAEPWPEGREGEAERPGRRAQRSPGRRAGRAKRSDPARRATGPPARRPHSTTRAPGAYAHPESGERGEPRGAILCRCALPDRSGSGREAAGVVDDGLPADQEW